MSVYYNVVLVPGDPLRSYRGNEKSVYVCMYVCKYVCMDVLVYLLYCTISARRHFT